MSLRAILSRREAPAAVSTVALLQPNVITLAHPHGMAQGRQHTLAKKLAVDNF